MTLHQVYGVTTPQQAELILDLERIPNDKPKNLEEWILSQVGEKIYERFIKGYTTKQWGRSPKELPSSIIKRLPIRLTYDDNYFNDKYQGIPIGGYTQIFEKLLKGIEVKLNIDYLEDKENLDNLAHKVIYTGPIDKFYGYAYGNLDYRSLRFESEYLDIPDYQGNALINYNEEEIPYTRIVEHKHFEFGKQDHTIITREYPSTTGEPYYPINDEKNNKKYDLYKKLMLQEEKHIFGGRLADYKYYDMHQVIASALHQVKLLI
jgi:UDP-galactopyranose mutase